MATFQEKFEKLQNDFSNLDPENIGAWPLPVKAICWIVVMVAVVALSYQFVLRDQLMNLDAEKGKELTLRKEFEQKVQDAANLDAYRRQMKEMNESFSTLLGQLPKDTEVPGLLDDISEKGQDSGLNFEAIDLKQEKKADFYVELPINIQVRGGYHDFGTFVSGVAGLPRIVTLHDFLIQSSGGAANKKPAPQAKKPQQVGAAELDAERRNSEELTMTIMAKTYRYKSAEDEEKDQDDKGAKGKSKGKGGSKGKDGAQNKEKPAAEAANGKGESK